MCRFNSALLCPKVRVVFVAALAAPCRSEVIVLQCLLTTISNHNIEKRNHVFFNSQTSPSV